MSVGRGYWSTETKARDWISAADCMIRLSLTMDLSLMQVILFRLICYLCTQSTSLKFYDVFILHMNCYVEIYGGLTKKCDNYLTCVILLPYVCGEA